jgi:adenylate kinase
VRRTCPNGHIFHVEFDPPEREGVCDVCGEPLAVRDDDKPEVIRKRLETYHEKTKPLVSYYDDRGVLRRIAGEAAPDEVADQVRRTLATLRMEQDETV